METDQFDGPPSITLPAVLPSEREQWLAMILELEANRVVLDRLALRYTMFRFTGGGIPAEQWNSSGMTSYLARSSNAGCIAIEDVKRYLALIAALAELQLGVSLAGRPRTLRDRCFITDGFVRARSDIMLLQNHLESALRSALEAAEPSSSTH